MMDKNALFGRIRRRSRGRRGAAMVEGAMVAGLWAVFFNLAVWIAFVYLAKIETQSAARYQTFYFANHDCQGEVPAYGESSFAPTVTVSTTQAAAQRPDGEMGNVGDQIANTSGKGIAPPQTPWLVAHGKATAAADYHGFHKVVSSESFVMCNEPRYDDGPFSAAKYIGDLAGEVLKQGGI
jgi:hypothetical protein